MKTFRRYEIERDADGMPTKMVWLGDVELPPLLSKAEAEAEKLAKHEAVYGKRAE